MIQRGGHPARRQPLPGERTARPPYRERVQLPQLGGLHVPAAPRPRIHLQQDVRPAAAERLLPAGLHNPAQLGPFCRG